MHQPHPWVGVSRRNYSSQLHKQRLNTCNMMVLHQIRGQERQRDHHLRTDYRLCLRDRIHELQFKVFIQKELQALYRAYAELCVHDSAINVHTHLSKMSFGITDGA